MRSHLFLSKTDNEWLIEEEILFYSVTQPLVSCPYTRINQLINVMIVIKAEWVIA